MKKTIIVLLITAILVYIYFVLFTGTIHASSETIMRKEYAKITDVVEFHNDAWIYSAEIVMAPGIIAVFADAPEKWSINDRVFLDGYYDYLANKMMWVGASRANRTFVPIVGVLDYD